MKELKTRELNQRRNMTRRFQMKLGNQLRMNVRKTTTAVNQAKNDKKSDDDDQTRENRAMGLRKTP